MNPKPVLRLEGLALFGAATVAYFLLGAPLWLFVVLVLAPDLSMLGYLGGPKAGSRLYNLFHTYVMPITVGAIGFVVGAPSLVWIALIWTAHIGIDRAIGYGLKHPSGFKDTHLSRSDSPTDPVVGLIADQTDPIRPADD